MSYIIETENLCKRYGKHYVVNNVNMHVEEGSVYGFVGENGSGKTTIMRLLMGLANATKGSYRLFGEDNKSHKIHDIRKQISAIVEAPSLVPTMNAKDNLKYAAMYYGIKDFSIIDDVLTQVGLEDTGNKKVKNFSLGMRQRLGIAVLLLNEPKLMLLDEPLNGLDPAGIAEVRDLIIKLNKKGITILISSHILSELEKVATCYGFIKKGNLLKEISAQDLADQCNKSISIKYDDMNKLEIALKKIGIVQYKITTTHAYIYDEIKPTLLLKKLSNEGLEIDDIQTNESSVEDYYLNMLKENR